MELGGGILILAALGLAVGAVAFSFVLKTRLEKQQAETERLRFRASAAEAALQDAPACCVTIGITTMDIHGLGRAERFLPGLTINDLTAGGLPDFIADYFSEEDAGAIRAALTGLLERGLSFDVIGALRRDLADAPDTLRLSGKRISDQSGKAICDVVCIEDLGNAADVISHDGLNLLPIAIWSRQNDGQVTWSNAEAQKLFGDSAVDLSTQTLERLGKRAVKRKVLQSTSYSAVQDGRRLILDVIETPLKDGSGTLGVAFDITAFAETQLAFDRQIEAHERVLESLTVGIAIFDRDKSLHFYNPALLDILRVDERALQDRPRLPQFLERLRDARALPEVVDWQDFRKRWEGFFVSVLEPAVSLEHLPDGRTLKQTISPHPQGGIIIALEDVTDSLALEASFNTLVDVQRAILDNLDEGAALFGEDHRLKFFNPAWARLWHFTPEELKGEPHLGELTLRRGYMMAETEEHKQKQVEVANRTITERKPARNRLSRLDGTTVTTKWLPLPDGNMLLTQLDITDTARIEMALTQRAEALEAADRLKSAFIANISYDLRTPLNAIVGFSEVLERQMFGPLNQRQSEYASAIRESSETLSNLINTMLDLASLEAGYLELDFAEVSIADVLSAAVDLISERARARNTTIRMLENLPQITLVADGQRLKQAVFNVLDNAINLVEKGAPIRVTAEVTASSFGGDVQRQAVAIKISYVPMAFRRAMAEGNPVIHNSSDATDRNDSLETPASLVDPASAQRPGAKMSLALVQDLISLHGGVLSFVQTKTGQSTVTLTIPLDLSAKQP